MVTWTDATIVKTYLKGAGTSLSNDEIDDMIEENEAYLKTRLKIPSTFTFDATTYPTHLTLRHLANLSTVMDIIASTNLCFLTLEHAALAANIYVDVKSELLEALDSKKSIDFILNNEG